MKKSDIQTLYQLLDEEDNKLTGEKIEAAAYEYFHNNKFQVDKGEADFIASLTYFTTEQSGQHTLTFLAIDHK